MNCNFVFRYGNLNCISKMEHHILLPAFWIYDVLYNNWKNFNLYYYRMKSLHMQINGMIDLMKEAIALGRVNHKASLVRHSLLNIIMCHYYIKISTIHMKNFYLKENKF